MAAVERLVDGALALGELPEEARTEGKQHEIRDQSAVIAVAFVLSSHAHPRQNGRDQSVHKVAVGVSHHIVLVFV